MPQPKAMTLGDFAALVGSTPRWCQNAFQTLGLGFQYDSDLARKLGLARLLQQHHGIPLRRAIAVADAALQGSSPTSVRLDDPAGVTTLVLDVRRYLTQFALRTARLARDAPRGPGRPPRAHTGGGIAAGKAYGLDLGALRSGLRLSPAERLKQLDANQRLIAALRGGRRLP